MKRRNNPAKVKARTARLRKKARRTPVASKPLGKLAVPTHMQPTASLSSPPWPIEFMQLEKVLKRLLSCEALSYDPADGAPFIGSFVEMENDLRQVPILIALLSGLPITKEFRERQAIIPLARAILPKTQLKIASILKGEDAEGGLKLVDELFHQAVVLDSANVREAGDRVLFRLAVDCGLSALLPRLVSRFYETFLADISSAKSLREWVFEAAHANVKLMRLKSGAPAETVLREKLFVRNFHGENLADELLHIAVTSQISLDNGIRLWLEAKKKQIAESDPDLIVNWTEILKSRKQENGFRSAWSKQKRDWGQLTVELEQLERYLLINEDADPNGDTENRFNSILHNGEQGSFSDVVESVVTRSPLSKTDPKNPTNSESDHTDLTPSENGLSEDEHDKDYRVIVIPKISLTGNHDLDNRIKPLKDSLSEKPLPLLPTPDLSSVRTNLIGLLPHLMQPIDRILNAMAAHAYIKIPPIVLVGPPGSGKTTLLQVLAEELDLPFTVIDGAGSSDANWLGVDMRWSTGASGVHLDLIQTHQIANPLIILDEIEKFGGSERNGDARARLLGLLEPKRATSFFDPYLSMPINLRSMNWAFTANSVRTIPGPLQNRLEIVQCPAPARQHLPLLAPQLLLAEYKNRGLREEWSEPLDQFELQQLNLRWKGGSIRNLKRLISVIVDSRMKFLSSA